MSFFRANGKLLLTAEYFILSGAKGIALPTRLGQSLNVLPLPSDHALLQWRSYDHQGLLWFSADFRLPHFECLQCHTQQQHIVHTLQHIAQGITQQQADFWQHLPSCLIQTHTDFPQHWGLGSSSTLIYNLATWAKVDPFDLNRWAFSGSGYDIACASQQQALLYQLLPQQTPYYQTIPLHFPFSSQLYWVHLGQKQNSREGIQLYRAKGEPPQSYIDQLNAISDQVARVKQLEQFEQLMNEHEQLISQYLQLTRQQDLRFGDYPYGIIKSLGAWGGDFVLASSHADRLSTEQYFYQKHLSTVIPFSDLVW